MNAPLIECRHASKRFGDTLAVDAVSFGLMPGEILSILGESGCGKTTLLRLIAGFEAVNGGAIYIRSEPASSETLHLPPERRNIGMVFQEYALFPHMSVAQNVSFGLHNASDSDRRCRAREALELVRLADLETRYPHELSGGQQQRVALARALAPRPIAMLLDEPFSNLDAALRHSLRLEVIEILRRENISAILVTHDREEAFAVADRVGVMVAGRLEQIASPADLYRAPVNPAVARMVGDCDFLPAVAHGNRAATAIGDLPFICHGAAIADGDALLVMTRPQDLEVTATSSGACRVKSLEFRGGETMAFVAAPGGAIARCVRPGYPSLSPGDSVALAPAHDNPFLAFPAE